MRSARGVVSQSGTWAAVSLRVILLRLPSCPADNNITPQCSLLICRHLQKPLSFRMPADGRTQIWTRMHPPIACTTGSRDTCHTQSHPGTWLSLHASRDSGTLHRVCVYSRQLPRLYRRDGPNSSHARWHGTARRLKSSYGTVGAGVTDACSAGTQKVLRQTQV